MSSRDDERLTSVRGFRAAWGGWALAGMDSFIYALVLQPALRELLRALDSPPMREPSATTTACCWPSDSPSAGLRWPTGIKLPAEIPLAF